MTTYLAAALILGLAGSLHCIGMCGPLVMIVHSGGDNRSGQWWINKLVYHFGRIMVYAAFGVITGLIGKSFIAMGFQQWLSLIAGLVLFFMLVLPLLGQKKWSFTPPLFSKITKYFSKFLQNKTPFKQLILGVINGLLPCGLVYAAMAASIAGGSPTKSALFMIVFGLATSPALIVVAKLSGILRSKWKPQSLAYIRVGLSILAVLFILRGANLGIPYLSPKMQAETCNVSCCQK